jgi:hypothetical protein
MERKTQKWLSALMRIWLFVENFDPVTVCQLSSWALELSMIISILKSTFEILNFWGLLLNSKYFFKIHIVFEVPSSRKSLLWKFQFACLFIWKPDFTIELQCLRFNWFEFWPNEINFCIIFIFVFLKFEIWIFFFKVRR